MTKGRSLASIVLAYLVAGGAAVGVGFALTGRSELLVALIADAVATVVVFGFSVRHDNTSVYDAYWSVAPPALFVFWLLSPAAADGNVLRQVLVGVLVFLWGIRLTANWVRGWPGMHHEDWRYVRQRELTGRFYWLVSFFGLHFFPTVLVFAGCVSVWVACTSQTPFGPLDLLAAVVTLGAILIETFADEQLVAFRRSNPPAGAIIDVGLWRYSRHPNYFGELSFWWGLWLFSVSAQPDLWWTFAGPAGMTLLFVFISVPMLDKRSLERRPAYADHIKRVSGLVPLPPKRPLG